MAGTQTTENVVWRAVRFVIRDVLFDVVRFPIWWYTTGMVQAGRFFLNEFQSVVDRLSIPILLRNLFKPMYGDYTKSGRIISFFMRIIVFFFRFIGLMILSVFLVAGFLLWLAALPLLAYQVFFQLAR